MLLPIAIVSSLIGQHGKVSGGFTELINKEWEGRKQNHRNIKRDGGPKPHRESTGERKHGRSSEGQYHDETVPKYVLKQAQPPIEPMVIFTKLFMYLAGSSLSKGSEMQHWKGQNQTMGRE